MFNSREFQSKLENLINEYSVENLSNTPDYVLAEYLMNCLAAYNTAIGARNAYQTGVVPRV